MFNFFNTLYLNLKKGTIHCWRVTYHNGMTSCRRLISEPYCFSFSEGFSHAFWVIWFFIILSSYLLSESIYHHDDHHHHQNHHHQHHHHHHHDHHWYYHPHHHHHRHHVHDHQQRYYHHHNHNIFIMINIIIITTFITHRVYVINIYCHPMKSTYLYYQRCSACDHRYYIPLL